MPATRHATIDDAPVLEFDAVPSDAVVVACGVRGVKRLAEMSGHEQR